MLKFPSERCSDYLARVRADAAATSPEALQALEERLDYLDSYAQGRTHCYISPDNYAPNSFYFRMVDANDETNMWFNGGVIYSGPGLTNDAGGARSDGGASSFTVSLDPRAAAGREHMWSVHT